MKKGQVYEATVERVDFPCKGIMQAEGTAVTVKNCLPGQKISFSVSKVRNGKAEGRLLKVLEKAPSETESPCSHFGVCGGCAYLSLPYEEQLKLKEAQVKRLLDRALERQTAPWRWEGIKGSPAVYGYRNKMEFSFGDEVKDGPLALGMHKRGSFYDVVTVDGCRIVDEDYRLILRAVLDYFAGSSESAASGTAGTGRGGIRYYHRQRHEGYLRHLVVRKAARTGEILVALVTTSQSPRGRDGEETGGKSGTSENRAPEGQSIRTEADKPGKTDERTLINGFLECLLDLERDGRLKGRFAGILHIVNDSQGDVVQSDRTEVLYGQDYFYEELLGLRFRISLFSFFQTNTYGAEVLYDTVREYVEASGAGETAAPEDTGSAEETEDAAGKPAGHRAGAGLRSMSDRVVFDLYSGTGTIAQLMAPVARKVIGVEIVEEAVRAAVRNAEENGLTNCDFIAGDVLKVLDTIEEKPDLIILDPPRDGIHPKALPKIISYNVERIVYISCKPTSLARDLEVFLENGYEVERACCADQFPWTGNIETIVGLQRQGVIFGG